MKNQNGVYIPIPKLDLIKAQLETPNLVQTKRALQELSGSLRSGLRVHPNQVIGLEQIVVGALDTRSDDKIRRWALNALARFGRTSALGAIRSALIKYRNAPLTSAAAIAAIYGIADEPAKLLKGLKTFDPIMLNLAALQHQTPSELDLRDISVNTEQASPDILQLALILVGLNRAPPNLFDPRHTNADLVKALGNHDNAIVSQYSIWAITENSELGLGDLGVDIRDVESYPSNVRSWIYRLIGLSPSAASKHIELLELGMSDVDTEVRLGSALGLRDTFFD